MSAHRREVLDRLEAALGIAERQLQQDLDVHFERYGQNNPFYEIHGPWEQKDRNGRFILLDALCAIAQLEATL